MEKNLAKVYIGNVLYHKRFCIWQLMWEYFVCYILLVEVDLIKSGDLDKHSPIKKKKKFWSERHLIQKW